MSSILVAAVLLFYSANTCFALPKSSMQAMEDDLKSRCQSSTVFTCQSNIADFLENYPAKSDASDVLNALVDAGELKNKLEQDNQNKALVCDNGYLKRFLKGFEQLEQYLGGPDRMRNESFKNVIILRYMNEYADFLLAQCMSLWYVSTMQAQVQPYEYNLLQLSSYKCSEKFHGVQREDVRALKCTILAYRDDDEWPFNSRDCIGKTRKIIEQIYSEKYMVPFPAEKLSDPKELENVTRKLIKGIYESLKKDFGLFGDFLTRIESLSDKNFEAIPSGDIFFKRLRLFYMSKAFHDRIPENFYGSASKFASFLTIDNKGLEWKNPRQLINKLTSHKGAGTQTTEQASSYDSNGNIRCHNCVNCRGCIDCNNCTDCNGCINCNSCRNCNGCIRCSNRANCNGCIDNGN